MCPSRQLYKVLNLVYSKTRDYADSSVLASTYIPNEPAAELVKAKVSVLVNQIMMMKFGSVSSSMYQLLPYLLPYGILYQFVDPAIFSNASRLLQDEFSFENEEYSTAYNTVLISLLNYLVTPHGLLAIIFECSDEVTVLVFFLVELLRNAYCCTICNAFAYAPQS